MFFMFNRNQKRQDAETGGAIPRAITAAGAKDFPELVGVNRELVQNTLTLAGALIGTGIVPNGVQREQAELAGIPVAHSRAVFVNDVEAMARWASMGASAASHAGQSMFGPKGMFEVGGGKLPHCFGGEARRGSGC
jgi:hypothetical protein